jgi:hypothetical protein
MRHTALGRRHPRYYICNQRHAPRTHIPDPYGRGEGRPEAPRLHGSRERHAVFFTASDASDVCAESV